MHQTQDIQAKSDSAFQKFLTKIARIGTPICYITTPIIIFVVVYYALTAEIELFFTGSSIIMYLIAGLTFFFMALMMPINKHHKRTILKIDWTKWISKGKWKFAIYNSIRLFAITITIFTVVDLIYNGITNKSIFSTFESLANVFIPVFVYFPIAIAYHLNIWNYAMKNENTFKNKFIDLIDRVF